jgi:hypothetical protein
MRSIRDVMSGLVQGHARLERVAAFLLTALLLVVAQPDEGLFKYEYQRGRPWMHDDLVAPFDFAIRKPKDVFEKEQEQIRERAPIYLRKDTAVSAAAQRQLRRGLASALAIDTSDLREVQRFNNRIEVAQAALTEVMERGIVQSSAELAARRPRQPVYVLVGNTANETDPSTLLSATQAYEMAMRTAAVGSQADEKAVAQAMAAAISHNIIFDAATTKAILDDELRGVSGTQGMIPEGLSVIKRGEMVDAQRWQVLESLRMEYEGQQTVAGGKLFLRLGQLLIIGLCLMLLYLFLQKFRPEVLASSRQVVFILLMMSVTVLVALLVRKVARLDLYMVPFCLMPVVVRSFFDTRVALFTFLLALIMVAFHAPNSYEFMFLELTAGIMALFTLADMHHRSRLFLSLIIVFCTYAIGLMGMTAMHEGTLAELDLRTLGYLGASVGLTLLAYPLIFLSEKVFGFVSDLTLLELSNSNHPLLRRLAAEAPGTFQHSLQVANLAEMAVYEVGGNALLVRTGALFHDVGKLDAPIYFVENQLSGMNPHDDMPFEESAAVIIGHVKKGLQLARKHDIPESVADFIRTHHGTSTVGYFYRNFLKQYPEREADRAKFTYPGPRPWTKEMAILMMADSVEAASRSLRVYDQETITQLVDRIMDHQMAEGQYDDADITLAEIGRIRKLFKAKLLNIYHVRTEYPD